MILGKIVGKTTTNKFNFLVDKNAKKFDYCQVYHRDYGYVLCQILELEKTQENITAKCTVIGYKDKKGRIKQIRSPFDVQTEVLKAEEDFIREVIVGESVEKGAFIGKLEGTDIDVFLDLNQLLTKHVAVLAKSGSGKSYSVGVLLEEIMERNVPLLIIDPHGEYSSMKKPNDKEVDIEKLTRFNLKPKAYNKKISIYGDSTIDPGHKPLSLSDNLSTPELLDLLPTKLTSSQMGLLYSTVSNMDDMFSFDSLIANLQAAENNQKWNIINTIECLKNLNIFSPYPTSYNELIQSGKCSIINFKGYEPEVQQIIVYKLLKDLFTERKKGTIPPFFLVVEEAHNYVPEKGYSDAKCSKIIKTIASEGRKFGLGLCVVSQRPAIVQKTVLSQCTTQLILKVTNPNDLKAVSSSVEGITSESEEEIRNMPIGSALVTGVVDKPLFVNVRARKSKHGGEAVDILGMQEDEKKFFEDLEEHNDQKLLPIIEPNLKKEDVRMMTGKDDIKINLVPCTMFLCKNRTVEYNLLVEMIGGSIVLDIEDPKIKSAFLPDIENITRTELKLLEAAFKLKRFSAIDIIQNSGLSFDANNDLNSLVEKGYIINKEGLYEISEDYIFSNPARNAFYGKIEFKNISYDEKLEKNQRLDTIKAKLSKFTNVIDQRECFLIHYES